VIECSEKTYGFEKSTFLELLAELSLSLCLVLPSLIRMLCWRDLSPMSS
jgi:hypothetical protein